MNISQIRLAWFRGAAEQATLETGGHSLLLYGANGTGKSSFVDALEYLISGGRIDHLSHEYSGRNQEKGVLNTHAPKAAVTSVEVHFADKREVKAVISPNGDCKFTDAGNVEIHNWDYRRTILRQDEVSRFVHSRKGDKYSVLLPLLGLENLETLAENLRQLERSLERTGKIEENRGAAHAFQQKRFEAFGRATDAAIVQAVEGLHQKYCGDVVSADATAMRKETINAVRTRINNISAELKVYEAISSVAKLDVAAYLKELRDANAKLADSVEPLLTEKLSVLASSATFAQKLTDDGDLSCPACGQKVAAASFRTHVNSEADRLNALLNIYSHRKRVVDALINTIKTLQAALKAREIEAWVKEQDQSDNRTSLHWLTIFDPDVLHRNTTEEILGDVEKNCRSLTAAAKKAIEAAPPDIRELQGDLALLDGANAASEAASIQSDIKRVEKLIAFVGVIESGIRQEIKTKAKTIVEKISENIQALWSSLHPNNPIDGVSLDIPDGDKAIDICLSFHGKRQNSPRLTLSEGYRNSLGLCIFLGLALQEETRGPLILDDVVVSFDRNHRGMVGKLLTKFFSNRQILLLTHDRDWYGELRHQLDDRNWRFLALRSFDNPVLGIQVGRVERTFDGARALIQERPATAAAEARKVMDNSLGFVAESFALRLAYCRGDQNEKRMAHEYLERIAADSTKCFRRFSNGRHEPDAAAKAQWQATDALLVTWANRGAHTDDVVSNEAIALIESCAASLDLFRCAKCNTDVWFANHDRREWVQCQCGDLQWHYGK